MPHRRDINDVERLASMVAECYSEGLILSLTSARQYLDVQQKGEAGVCGIVPMLCSGMLELDDFFFNGEEEVPVFLVRSNDGRKISFAEHNKWRFT